MTTITLLYLFVFLLLYFAADALHDVWVVKERSFYANSKRGDISEESKKRFEKQTLSYSRKWHALDALIKGFVIANISYWMVGFDWLFLSIIMLWSMTLRWLWFDACWNWFRGVGFWFRGTTAKTDTFPIKNWLFFTLKFLLFFSMSGILVFFIQ